jgi:predicted peptidase
LSARSSFQAGQSPWTTQKGTVAFGYYSPLDGSVQPYQLTIPESYDGSKAVPLFRLDAWQERQHQHVNFLYAANIGATSRFLTGVSSRSSSSAAANNASHQAGEVDVYETVAAISRRFKVDSTRLVLRGFSLGGAGAWHVGLHNPSMWVAADIGAGTWPRHYLMKDSTRRTRRR